MKITLVFVAFIFLASNAVAADSFATRVHEAKVVEASSSGKAYQPLLWQQVGSYTATVMRRCFPDGTRPDVTTFTLVADILPSRALSRVEVRPKTKMSACFASGFERAAFPALPESFGNRIMPIEIDMTVKQ
jgi:hypothetical protein